MKRKRVEMKVYFNADCVVQLVAAMELLGEIAGTYPDDDRFRRVIEQVMDAVGRPPDKS